MIKLLRDPFSGKVEKIALPDAVSSYTGLCEKMGWPLDSTIIIDGDQAVTDKSLPIKNPQHLTVTFLPEGGDNNDVVGIVTGVALVVAGVVTSNPLMIAQGALTLVGTAWAHEQRRKLENQTGPGSDDFDAINARLNKNQYGQPMPVFIGRGRFSPDMSTRPYQRMEGRWQKPRQITYATYTYGDARGVTFSNLKSGDIKLEGSDGVTVKTGAEIPGDTLVDTGAGAVLAKPAQASNEPVATYSTVANARLVEIDIMYAAGRRTKSGDSHAHGVEFTIETKTEGSEWQLLAHGKRLTWSAGLGVGGGQASGTLSKKKARFSLSTGLGVTGLFVGDVNLLAAGAGVANNSGNNEDSSRRLGINASDPAKITAWGRDGTPHRGTLGFSISDSDSGTAIRLTFKVPWQATSPRTTSELSVEQFRSYYPDNGDYSEQQRVQVQYASDGPWSRALPPLTADFQATVDNAPTSNPADWFREFLKRAEFPDTMIDFDSITAWRQYCADRDIEYNRVLRSNIKIADILISLCEVGHAKLAPIRGKLGVILFDDNTLVREFTLDRQLKDPEMSVAVGRKPKISGLELAYLDMDKLTLVPVQIGVAPFQRVQVPGITRKAQARRELEIAWRELQLNHPVITFSADDSALDLYRGQRIKVHGQRGVFTGVSECRVLAITAAENNVQITARVELVSDNTDAAQSISPSPPAGASPVAKAAQIKVEVQALKYSMLIVVTWRNEGCTGQSIKIIDENGTESVQLKPDAQGAWLFVPLINQLYTLELTPILGLNQVGKSLGAITESVTVYIDARQAIDTQLGPPPKVRGLRLIHLDRRANPYGNEFSGGDCAIGWERLREYPSYRVRVYDSESNQLLRSTVAQDNRYHYSLQKNKADTQTLQLAQTATRNLRFTVAAVSADQTAGKVASITVYNRLPAAPRLAVYIASPGYIEVKITTTPTDPDFMGYLVWLGSRSDFELEGNRVDTGNCIKLLDAHSSSFSIHVPPEVTQWVKVAAFDAFTDNPQKLNVSDSLELTGIKLLDIADFQSKLKVGWNQLEFNDGGDLVDGDGNLSYDLGDATPAARERFQQFLAAGLKGIKAPFKAWHADLIDGALITGKSIDADKLVAGSIEVENLSSNVAWSGFLSSHEMDVHNIYAGRYEYDANGKPLLDSQGHPQIKPGGGQKLYDYLEGRLSALNGRFGSLDVAVGNLIHHYSKGWYGSGRGGVHPDGAYSVNGRTPTEYWNWVKRRDVYIFDAVKNAYLPSINNLVVLTANNGMTLTRHVKYEGKVLQVHRQISRVIATSFLKGHLKKPSIIPTTTLVDINYRQILSFRIDGETDHRHILGEPRSVLDASYGQYYGSAASLARSYGHSILFFNKTLEDTFFIPDEFVGKINNMYFDVAWEGTVVRSAIYNTAHQFGEVVPSAVRVTEVRSTAIAILKEISV